MAIYGWPVTEIFRDRRRAESFGDLAVRYDEARPSYPHELIEWLTIGAPGTAIDVGCGTGRVARLLMSAGWTVLGVEVDERMAAVARAHGVDVLVSRFEGWTQERNDVDLVCSGQAWHWVDPDVGYARAAALLRPGGRLAVFWNSYHYDAPVMEVFTRVFGRHAPELLTDSVPLGTADPGHARLDAEAIRRLRGSFDDPEFRVFVHDRVQTVEHWLAEATTHSPIAMLPHDVKQRLFTELADALDEATDGRLKVSYQTRVTSARRSGP